MILIYPENPIKDTKKGLYDAILTILNRKYKFF